MIFDRFGVKQSISQTHSIVPSRSPINPPIALPWALRRIPLHHRACGGLLSAGGRTSENRQPGVLPAFGNPAPQTQPQAIPGAGTAQSLMRNACATSIVDC
eukprot:5905569-Pyramimonas_sp.AAC.1